MYNLSLKSIVIISFLFIMGCKQNNQTNHELSNDLIPEYTKVSHEIDLLLKTKHTNGKLNGNVLVIKNGQEVYKKSFGFADGSKTTKLNENFQFNIGSIYKEFPAVAIMQLKEKGQLDITDKLNKYLKDLPKWSDSISIKSLLQYSSGLPLMKWDEHFGKGITVTKDIVIDDLKNVKSLEFIPETDYLYSNYNPLLLSEIVEKITNQVFATYAQNNIFKPYGLTQSKINSQYPYKNRTLMAIPFNDNFEEDNYHTTVPLVLFSSTTADMYKWFKLLDSFKIVNKESIKFLSKEAKTGINIQAPLGHCDWENGKIVEHFHHGSSANYECVVRRFKQRELTIVILTNQKHRNVYEISDEILEIMEKI